jgi:DNA polymerase III alpha subunit
MYSNLRTLDCISKPIDYINRAKELGHTTYFTTEHGYQGNIFEAHTLCNDNGLKCIYGVEAYYVDDVNDKSSRAMYHIILIAMTERARNEINKIMSVANTDGYYYKPRIDLNILLSLTPTDTVVTTACVAGRMFKSKIKTKKTFVGYEKEPVLLGYDEEEDEVYLTDDDGDIVYKTNSNKPVYKEENYEDKDSWINDFLIPVKNHFGKNFFLEVQAHVDDKQKEHNRKILEAHKKYGVALIHANDSHYIYPSDAKNRDLFLKAKGIVYEEEGGFILDYPDSDEIFKRYEEQGVLTKEEVEEALNNTLIFDNAEGIHIDKEFKIPKVTDGDSNKVIKQLINEGWAKEKNNVPKEKWKEYIQQIKYEYKIIEDCGMADYFILDHYIVKKAVNEYNAILTRSGRGSAVSFYVNKLLGLTEVDRISAPITLYPTRFMSAERILSSRSLPDIDLNWADVTPVIQASKDILGEDGIYYMIAYKPLQESSAFRLWCKANDMHISEYDEIAKNLEEYENHPQWKQLIEDSKVFRGVVESVAPSPCSFLLSNDKISEIVGLVKVGDVTCCCLDGYNCDVYKYLKNDYLTVMVYQIIDEVYKLVGRPIDDINTLIKNCDDKVWDIYAKGLTTTINQADSDFDKQILKKYQPKNLAELSAYVAAIRPGFASLLNNFVERQPYTTGVKDLDDILEDSFHYLIYQESIMKYLVWLGIEEKGTYDIIKKIAKKKFKEDELKELKTQLLAGWVKNVGKEEGFNETWQVVEDAAHYSFNASHSLSVAIDSLYGAYLKAHYPLEYFTVALSLYSGDMDRTANLISEMNYFGIELKPIKFRHSNANYNIEKETNSIYKGVGAVKYCNEEVGNTLYELRDQHFDSFLDLLEVFPGNSRQREILIKLGYFEEFGGTLKLLKLCDLYDLYHGKKLLKKDKLNLPIELVQKYAISETAKQYKFDGQSMDNLLREFAEMVPDGEIPLRTRLESEAEYLGYISYTNPKFQNTGFVLNVDTKYSPKITVYRLDTGETTVYKLQKAAYQNNAFDKGHILKFYSEERQKSRKVDDKWVKLQETEPWITNYIIKQTDL